MRKNGFKGQLNILSQFFVLVISTFYSFSSNGFFEWGMEMVADTKEEVIILLIKGKLRKSYHFYHRLFHSSHMLLIIQDV